MTVPGHQKTKSGEMTLNQVNCWRMSIKRQSKLMAGHFSLKTINLILLAIVGHIDDSLPQCS